MSHENIQMHNGKFFPETKSELIELVRDDDVHLASIDTSRITDMSCLFCDVERKDYFGIETWDTSHVVNMQIMFENAVSFNQPLETWDVAHVEDMSYMFHRATSFNQPLGSWDVSHVKDMSGMFASAKSFNQPIEHWDVSSVKDMSYMFSGAQSFNQPLGSWDVSSVKDMHYMFGGAKSFNQPLERWDVSNVKDMFCMFMGAESFHQPLESWVEKNLSTFREQTAPPKPSSHADKKYSYYYMAANYALCTTNDSLARVMAEEMARDGNDRKKIEAVFSQSEDPALLACGTKFMDSEEFNAILKDAAKIRRYER